MNLLNFKKSESGSVLIIIAIALPVIIALLLVTNDMSRNQGAHSRSQGASDASVLATTDYIMRDLIKKDIANGNLPRPEPVINDEIKAYALSTYEANLKNDQKYTKVLKNLFDVNLNETKDTVQVDAYLEVNNDFNLLSSKSTVHTTSAAKLILQNSNVEIAIAVDNGSKMQGRFTDTVNGKKTTNPDTTYKIAKQFYAKKFIKSFSDVFKKDATTLKDGVRISVIPFNDTVKLTNTTAADPVKITAANLKTWFKDPSGIKSGFAYCLGRRGDSNDSSNTNLDVLDTPPTNFTTKYNFYDWPQELINKIQVAAYRVTGVTQGLGTIPLQTDGNLITHTARDAGFAGTVTKQPESSRLLITFNKSPISGGRFAYEVDFVKGSGSESVMVDLGESYKSLIQSGANCYSPNDHSGQPENAYTSFFTYDGDDTGKYLTHLFLPHSNAVNRISTPYRYAKYLATDNGGGYGPGSCGRDTAGYGGTDNSDFGISWISLGDCFVKNSVVMTNKKTSVDRVANSLMHPTSTSNAWAYSDGLSRIDVGISWAWRALSPSMQGVWDPKQSSLPLGYNQSKKYMIVITQGENWKSPEDDNKQLQVCDNVKNAGITLYYLTVDGSRPAQNLGTLCASAGKYFNLTNDADLVSKINLISQEINQSSYGTSNNIMLVNPEDNSQDNLDPEEEEVIEDEPTE
jgi:hypothetical protein